MIRNALTTATCPLVPWYRFHVCQITTCKNFTSETEHCCLELDRKKPEGTKQFSDAELNLYKFKQKGISTRLVQIHRKTAIENVKVILILREFIEWLTENFELGGVFTHREIRALEKVHPLKIKRLGWKNWMWEYLLDDKVWQKFVQKVGGECSTFNVYQLLGIKIGRFENLLREFHNPKERK